MAMGMAHQDHIVNNYGIQCNRPNPLLAVPATGLRIWLKVTYNLRPTDLELTQTRRQATARLWLERIKFVSRLMLLLSYWKQVDDEPSSVVGGLLQEGGTYRMCFGGSEMETASPTGTTVRTTGGNVFVGLVAVLETPFYRRVRIRL